MPTIAQQHPTTGANGVRGRARCKDQDAELWFPTGTSGPALLQIAQAKAECHRCPVMDRCREWALDNPRLAEAGVWGGLSEDERRALKRRNARARAARAGL